MIVNSEIIKYLKETSNYAYQSIKVDFLYNSNKLEGSTFTKENLEKYLQENKIGGDHKINDVYETINSIKLFDFVIETLNEPISKQFILKLHRKLKDNTLDYVRGLAGRWGSIPNTISSVGLKLAQPWEIDMRVEELLSKWESSSKSFEDIVKFHARFENIHPFQDGNGRIGRFLMLKQCIENDIDLILIDNQYSKEYKQALYIAQSKNDYRELFKIFKQCQNLSNERLSFLKETVEYMQEHDIELNLQSM